jgi:short-subunit dehydrogenase
MNIVITGGGRGIGKAIAEKFFVEGHKVLICSRNEKQLATVKTELGSFAHGGSVEYMAADLSLKNEVVRFANWVNSVAAPDVLVNNAGVYLPGNCYDEPEGSMETMMATNFYSAYHLTRALLPAMLERKCGHIFNICSIASLQAYAGGGGYSVSKYALKGFTDNLRHEMKPHGIKVTGVYPGAVFTDSWRGFDNSSNRIMEPSDIASMIYASTQLSPQAVVEDLVFRPQLGDL